jgi:hypothetical protein
MTLIMVTHEMRFAREVGDKLVFMHQGKVHEVGDPKVLFANPQTRSWRISLARWKRLVELFGENLPLAPQANAAPDPRGITARWRQRLIVARCRGYRPRPLTMPQSQAKNLSLIAAIDLGSNSFHMVVAKAQNGEIRILERLGEKVQLAAGIDDERQLSEESMQRGLDCLKRFAQLINGMPLGAVRIVGTNALREARNRGEFIRRAEEILGHPVEVISGREEAPDLSGRVHTLADTPGKRLVADIGGGSTEFIIGQRFEPLLRESLQMGCVSFTQRYFKDGKITPARYAQAYTAARLEIMSIEHALHRLTWDEAIGSSGTIRAIGLALKAGGHGNGEVNAEGLAAQAQTVQAGRCREDRLRRHQAGHDLPGRPGDSRSDLRRPRTATHGSLRRRAA